jgi:ribonuclease R
MYVEGLIHITELGGEYFRFDEARQELRGERTGTRYAIGTRVRIQVSRVDLDGRKIDFRLVQEGEGLVNRAMADKGVAKETKVRSTHAQRAQAEPAYAEPKYAEPHARRAGAKAPSRKGAAAKAAKATKSGEKSASAKKKAPRLRR